MSIHGGVDGQGALHRYKGMLLSLYKNRIHATCSTTDGSRDCLREKSQREKAKYPGTSLISAIEKRILAMNTLSKHFGLTGSQNALALASGECWGEKTAVELGIGKATQLHLR